MIKHKTGLFAAAFVSMGLIGFVPADGFAQGTTVEVAQAKKDTMKKPMRQSRAERNAAEVQKTKELNEAQLRR